MRKMQGLQKLKHFLLEKIPLRRLTLLFIDLFIVAAVYFSVDLSFWSYTGAHLLDMKYLTVNVLFMLIALLVFRFWLGIYTAVWRYANTLLYLNLIIADTLAALSFFIFSSRHRGIYLTGWATVAVISITSILTLVSRFIYQIYRSQMHTREVQTKTKKNVAIIGAGQVGVNLAEELRTNDKSGYHPYRFIDVNKNKIGNKIAGIKVIDGNKNIVEKIKTLPIEELIVAIPSMSAKEKGELIFRYSKTGLKVKIYDFALDSIEERDGKRVIRDIKIEDLLGREPVIISDDTSLLFYQNKTILITGGGGSIGSELCRQLALCTPAKLIILDNYENNAYDLYCDLKRIHGDKFDVAVEIATVRDRERLECIFNIHRPQIVFHTAAHKHVPLMEHNCYEAIQNNIFGTYNTADMAEKYGCEKFILISTDKAVNPTNIMGASKRICEMIVQSRTDSKTSFSAVRFGNVLGSSGSVIPLFKKQLADGGPLTVTDKRIIRYFMTIPEASQLVMQAGIMARQGELFVLDMGKPVKIIELAENMIKLSGYLPYKEIDIVEIGLRAGEKLYEELLIDNEAISFTLNKKIFIEKDSPYTREQVEEKLEILTHALSEYLDKFDINIIKSAMKKVLPSYKNPEILNGKTNKKEREKSCMIL